MLSQATPNLLASAISAKKTRQELATHFSISKRYVDVLTQRGILPFYKLGKSVRYDLAEVEAVMRERYHVRAKPTKQGRIAKPAVTITD